MAYEPHTRITMSGAIGYGTATEQFSMRFAVGQDDTPGLNGGFNLDQARFDDLVADIRAWFARVDSGITDRARLQRVKAASINAGGYTVGTVKEAAFETVGALDAQVQGTRAMPWQVSQKITLHTAGDGGKVKGGFYVPCPSGSAYDPATNLWSVADITARTASLDTLVEAINNQPGEDADGFVVVVASQGRKNKDGTVRVGPKNHPVTHVTIGRRPDVQRRRANKVTEARLGLSEIEGN